MLLLRSVLDYLEHSAKRFPNKIAFADGMEAVTFLDLKLCVEKMAERLSQAVSGQTGQAIVLFSDRTIHTVGLFLAIAASGNFYVPIDPQIPENRLKLMLETVRPAAIISSKRLPEGLLGSFSIISRKDLLDSGNRAVISGGSRKPGILQEADADSFQKELSVRSVVEGSPYLYAIFTSGSTGVPKCVVKTHRSVYSFVDTFTSVFPIQHTDILGNQASFDFDVSAKDIYIGLKTGATVHILGKELFLNPQKLMDKLVEERITTLIWTTSAICVVSMYKAFTYRVPTALRQVFFSGEAMPVKHLNAWREQLPDTMFVNLYAPTEVTGNCVYHIVERYFAQEEELPIGKPFEGIKIYLLNENRQPVPIGEMGEIFIGGSFLSSGYYHNPEQTANAFLPNPVEPEPEIVYRSGDLGRLNEYGELMYCGRKDSQIKHLGRRIELGEIEVAVNSLPCIDRGCCLYDASRKKIVLFYQARTPCDREIAKELMQQLPKYMLPNRMVHFVRLPVNKNEKIDRERLKKEYING